MLHEFTVTIAVPQVEEVIEKLNVYGYYNLYYDQPIEQVTIEDGYGVIELHNLPIDLKAFLEEDETGSVDVAKTREEIASILGVKMDDVEYRWIESENWQQPFPVINLQNGWYIKPTLSEEEIDGSIIHFEPPRAFGSGLHGTTQDCLRYILREDLSGKRILDLGTGAGLLSIAAALAGAQQVEAVDIEDVEAEVLYNARLNEVESRIEVLQGNVLSPTFPLDGIFDWIFANIGGIEIKQLRDFIDSHLSPQGKLILSGMVEWNYQEVLSVYEEIGYELQQVSQSDEWVSALVSRPLDGK